MPSLRVQRDHHEGLCSADSTGRHSDSRRTQVRKLAPGGEITLQVSRGRGAALLRTQGWAARRLCSLSPSLHGCGKGGGPHSLAGRQELGPRAQLASVLKVKVTDLDCDPHTGAGPAPTAASTDPPCPSSCKAHVQPVHAARSGTAKMPVSEGPSQAQRVSVFSRPWAHPCWCRNGTWPRPLGCPGACDHMGEGTQATWSVSLLRLLRPHREGGAGPATHVPTPPA